MGTWFRTRAKQKKQKTKKFKKKINNKKLDP